MSSLVLAGIDPGSRKLGVAIAHARKDLRSFTPVEGRTFYSRSFPPEWTSLLREFLLHHQPAWVFVEQPYLYHNPRTLLRLAQTAGICIALAQMITPQIHELLPAEIKTLCTGDGKASRQWLHQILLQEFPALESYASLPDTMDAFAVCYAGFLKLQAKQLETCLC